MKIGLKLLTGTLLIAVLSGIVGYIAIHNFNIVSDRATYQHEKGTLPLVAIGQVTALHERARVNVRDMIFLTNPELIEQKIEHTNRILDSLSIATAAYQQTIDSPKGEELFDEFQTTRSEHLMLLLELYDIVRSGQKEQALLLLEEQESQKAEEVGAKLSTLVSLKVDVLTASEKMTTDSIAKATRIILLVVVLSLCFAIVVVIMLNRSITKPLETIASDAKKLSKGDTAIEATATDRKDEIGVLQQAFVTMVAGIRRNGDVCTSLAAGDISVEIVLRSENDRMGKGLTAIADTLRSLDQEMAKLSSAAVQGNLAVRGQHEQFTGAYKHIIQGVNDTLDAVITPLNEAAWHFENIANGNIPALITKDYQGDFNNIKNNINKCIYAVNHLVSDINALANAANEGKLSQRADASQHGGDFAVIIQGVNNTLDNVIQPMMVAADFIAKVSRGEDLEVITDEYKGDYNIIKNNINNTRYILYGIIDDVQKLTVAASEGQLHQRAELTKYQGGWRVIVGGINNVLNAVIAPLTVAADYVDRIAKGDIPEPITEEYKGDFAIIKNNLNKCIIAMNALVADARMLADAAAAGKLSTRADGSRHQGDFRMIVEGVNDTLDNVINPLTVAADYVDRIAKGDIPEPITDEYKGDFAIIKNNLNKCIAAMNALVTDARMLADAAAAGKLSTRADGSRHQGDFRMIVEGVNDTLDNVINPLTVAADYVDRIAKGDIPEPITTTYHGDFNTIKNNLNKCINAVNLLISDVGMLAEAAAAGKLSTRADGSRHQGDFRAIVEGVNDTLDNVINPLTVAADYVNRIAKGDIPEPITDEYKGDFAIIKNNLNKCIAAMNALVTDARMLAEAAAAGKLSTRADGSRHQGDFRAIVEGVNDTLDNVINPLTVAAEYVDRIAKGDIPEPITTTYHGDFNTIKNNLNKCINAVNLLISDAGMLAEAAAAGKLSTRADGSRHQGDFRAIVEGVNDTLDNVINPLTVAADYVNRIAKGDIPPLITDEYKGDFNILKNNLNTCIQNIMSFSADMEHLVREATAGNLDARSDDSRYKGDWAKLVQEVNTLVVAMVVPIRESIDVLSIMAQGDLTPRVVGEYQGEFSRLKNSLNAVGDNLGRVLAEVIDIVTTTANATAEISASIEEISSGTEMQAHEAANVASAIEEMNATVAENSKNASLAANVADRAGKNAEQGGKVVADTMQGMQRIAEVVTSSADLVRELGSQSEKIGKIIHVIDEIANQTNLLALNAAIEAARAGEQGRGFAVVADEVRKLAERTSYATQEIQSMIETIQHKTRETVTSMEQGTTEVKKGTSMASSASASLGKIITRAHEVVDVITQVATASEEQSTASIQIAKNIDTINNVIRESNIGMQQIAHAAEDLNRLTTTLKATVDRFKIASHTSPKAEYAAKASVVGKAYKKLPAAQ